MKLDPKQNPQQNQPSKENFDQTSKENFEYIYFIDSEGRLKRLRKKEYESRAGYTRIKIIQKYYFWWKKKSFDYRNAIITLLMGISYAYIIYKTSMYFSQNQLQREIKARLPFEYQNDQIKEMKRIHKQQLKKQGKMSLL